MSLNHSKIYHNTIYMAYELFRNWAFKHDERHKLLNVQLKQLEERIDKIEEYERYLLLKHKFEE